MDRDRELIAWHRVSCICASSLAFPFWLLFFFPQTVNSFCLIFFFGSPTQRRHHGECDFFLCSLLLQLIVHRMRTIIINVCSVVCLQTINNNYYYVLLFCRHLIENRFTCLLYSRLSKSISQFSNFPSQHSHRSRRGMGFKGAVIKFIRPSN